MRQPDRCKCRFCKGAPQNHLEKSVICKVTWALQELSRSMGQTESSSSESPRPSGIVKLNDSLYELYSPEKGQPELDIVFFHGLQMTECRDAYWRTWMSVTEGAAQSGNLWPREWLAPKFPRSRILSVSYDSCAFMSATSGRQDLFTIGERLVADLVHLGGVGQCQPVVMVGHSLGGLVLKQVIMEAYKQSHAIPDNARCQITLQNFVNNIKGLFYFSTPHGESQLMSLLNGVPSGWKGLSKLMMKISGVESQRLNDNFRIWRTRREDEVKAFSICETRETPCYQRSFRKQSSLVVSEASARCDTNFYMAIQEVDHFQVVKPKDSKDPRLEALSDFISAVTRIPIMTFDWNSYKMAIGLPVEKLEGYSNHQEPDIVTGVPVKAYESGQGTHPYIKIGVPVDLETIAIRYSQDNGSML